MREVGGVKVSLMLCWCSYGEVSSCEVLPHAEGQASCSLEPVLGVSSCGVLSYVDVRECEGWGDGAPHLI